MAAKHPSTHVTVNLRSQNSLGTWELNLEFTQETQPLAQDRNFSWLPEVELARKKSITCYLPSMLGRAPGRVPVLLLPSILAKC